MLHSQPVQVMEIVASIVGAQLISPVSARNPSDKTRAKALIRTIRTRAEKQTVQVRQGCINFTTLAELPEGAPVMTGTFSIHNTPVVILFDSGASHSFINAKFGAKVGLDSVTQKGPI